MSLSLQFFADAALTLPLSSWGLRMDAGANNVVKQVWLGSTKTDAVFSAEAGPLRLVIKSTSDGESASNLRLALTEAGLGQAEPGAELVLGDELRGGAANAKTIYMQWARPGSDMGAWSNLQLLIMGVSEK